MSPSELMAFGDANNDKDMLEFASIVMLWQIAMINHYLILQNL